MSVESTRPYGVMCRVREGLSCLLHVNEMASQGGREPSPDQDFTVGQALKVGGRTMRPQLCLMPPVLWCRSHIGRRLGM